MSAWEQGFYKTTLVYIARWDKAHNGFANTDRIGCAVGERV